MIGARVSILQIYSLRVYQYKLVKQLDMQNVTLRIVKVLNVQRVF